MSVLREWKDELVEAGILHSFYRVQGGKSYNKFSFDGNRLTYDFPDQYTYFSDNQAHHNYYLRKRVNQLVLGIGDYDTRKDYLSTKKLYSFRSFLPQIQEKFHRRDSNNINIDVFLFIFFKRHLH